MRRDENSNVGSDEGRLNAILQDLLETIAARNGHGEGADTKVIEVDGEKMTFQNRGIVSISVSLSKG